MLTIDSVMSTALLTVKDTDLVSTAAARMVEAGIRHLPVTDERNHVVGVISDRDVAKAGARSKQRIGAVMSRDVKTVRPGERAERAIALMLENKIGSLPVVDEEENLIGIVTETDFLHVAYQSLTGGRRERGTNQATV